MVTCENGGHAHLFSIECKCVADHRAIDYNVSRAIYHTSSVSDGVALFTHVKYSTTACRICCLGGFERWF